MDVSNFTRIELAVYTGTSGAVDRLARGWYQRDDSTRGMCINRGPDHTVEYAGFAPPQFQGVA